MAATSETPAVDVEKATPCILENGHGYSKPSVLVKASMVVTQLIFISFIFGLPLWSRLFYTDRIFAEKCWTPAAEIYCGNGANYSELVVTLGLNRTKNGQLYGCGCGEGVFGDWVCVTYQKMDPASEPEHIPFSISYFIATAPGTGAMAAFSAFPILAMWRYGLSVPKVLTSVNPRAVVTTRDGTTVANNILWFTQFMFQFFFGLFLINTECFNQFMHSSSVNFFIAALMVHYLTVAWMCGMRSRKGLLIQAMAWFGFGAEMFGYTAKLVDPASYWGQYGFFFGECVGLSCAFSMAPVLALLDSEDEQ